MEILSMNGTRTHLPTVWIVFLKAPHPGRTARKGECDVNGPGAGAIVGDAAIDLNFAGLADEAATGIAHVGRDGSDG